MTTAAELFGNADLILLDFDGPVTRLLPPPANARLADKAREAAHNAGVPITAELATSTDHLAFIRAAGAHSPEALKAVEALCTAGEVKAAKTSPITPGIVALLTKAHDETKTVAVVTNNSPECVTTFLERQGLRAFVDSIHGRIHDRPDLLKPHPHTLNEALKQPHHRAVMIGDSVSDIQAANTVGVPSIGLAKNDRRAHELHERGASAIARNMYPLIQAHQGPFIE